IPPTVKWSPAREAQPRFERGDTIVQINDMTIGTYRDADAALARYTDEPIRVTVRRTPLPSSARRNDGKQQENPAETVSIAVEPTARRDFGLVMPLGSITAIQRDSPAEKSGLHVGDRILSINNQPVGNPLTLDSRLRRLAGTPVVLEIQRKTGDAAA